MSSSPTTPELPSWLVWRENSVPDCNVVLVKGEVPALVDSGFVGNSAQTTRWAFEEAPDLSCVVNTHWHSDHVGGNAELQAAGVEIVVSESDAKVIAEPNADACLTRYLDQPVAPYRVNRTIRPGDRIRMGDLDWEVLATPGHTPSHLSFWQADERVLIAGDVLSTYDVGWINVALDGVDAARQSLESVELLASLRPRVVLPGHGPRPVDLDAFFANGRRRLQRLIDSPEEMVWYGARRVFGFALMIYDGIDERELPSYLHSRGWVQGAARQLHMTVESFSEELVQGMLKSGGIARNDGRIRTTAPYSRLDPKGMQPHIARLR